MSSSSSPTTTKAAVGGYGSITAPSISHAGPSDVVVELATDVLDEVTYSRTALAQYALIVTLGLTIAVAVFFKTIEAWPWLTAFYFTTYVTSGVGYGDVSIKTANWRYFTLGFTELVGVLVVGSTLSIALNTMMLTEDEEDLRSCQAARNRLRKCSILCACVVAVAGLVVGISEDWSLAQTVYWALDTVTTVGCGYVDPTSTLGRACSAVVFLVAAPIYLVVAATLIAYPRVLVKDAIRRKAFDECAEGRLSVSSTSREGFVLELLKSAKSVHPDDVRDANALYDSLVAAAAAGPDKPAHGGGRKPDSSASPPPAPGGLFSTELKV
eukprot:CAMPEP_0185700770 /NCGR_PEP_ID=MMETSP1164-20130828/7679_1 /TAXON_ID=1104430 /ORGANISM="Chrysoreinhardia sp, Strain CCMP2950" /LENGTH=325 /DNA_ID=CAMNT_0028367721 /DNA_START=26 /DNA_END=1003 /DNA_ORIENTATION=-